MRPKVCIGNYNDGRWGHKRGFELCPKNHAIMAIDPAGYGYIPLNISAEEAPTAPVCCPLPSSDILTDEHVNAPHTCPKEFVATGATHDFRENTRVQPRNGAGNGSFLQHESMSIGKRVNDAVTITTNRPSSDRSRRPFAPRESQNRLVVIP